MSIATHHMQNQFTGRSCLVHQITEASSIQFPTKRVAMLLINYIDLKKNILTTIIIRIKLLIYHVKATK